MAASSPLSQPPSLLRNSHFTDVVLWLLRQRRRWRVVGESMVPLLQHGVEVLIDPAAYRQCRPQPGDLVVAYHPRQPDLPIVKWVVYVEAEGCFLKGLNESASTDSREYGLVPFTHILGQVVCRFP
ncbi:nickel-type superoxide dismutase maturation protease [Nodosilinea sp. LEGE 07088]|uniref:nickel-type superoxide dismutase maturation protease n=1 Tax=Nodosilinea sp. LEGE 07088 TaxID=2777968 RepID=UPI001D157DC3|nr:nickel-type superoxide dismutase maturation protease [Nodosilinea sp. LEGE 07088]